ncbi:GGDEF domain-containing protein [Variovorax guangxiensis]|uniref:diguanylate cyclase n=1 Tax=Variovorax guangxiensis TaxID=1775474 RepID=A0A840FUA3_9BURK|nr:sensor domain-containing diguanylate cyclase [Variovorax guangxiensis]MBB4225753.1 diguanylate cyclase (GGDEF)-like protein [Variovorax guangxiensis]
MLRRLSLASRTVVFVALVCLGLLAIDGWNSWQSRQLHLRQMSVATSNLARAMAQQADDQIKLADTVLVGLVERIESEGTGPAEVARLREFLALRVAQLPQLDGLHIYDEDGNWVANSRQIWPQNLNNAEREYFQFHRASASRGPHVGVPVTSRTNGRALVPISRRINHADGSFAGVALATIRIDFFVNFYASLDIGQAGALGLIREDGTMITRRPYSPSTAGRDMRGSDLFQAYRSQGPVGTAYIRSAQDGVLRLNSFRRLPNYPLFVAASLSKEEILADWWRETLWHSGGGVLLVLVVAAVGWRLVKQFELQVQTEAELRRARDALETLNGTLKTLAMEDGLTGLANRRKFDVTLNTEIGRAVRDASTLALIMIDVDCFKQYNDIYGHAAGDECLQKIGRTVAALAARRPGDLAARYGGEELAVLLPNTDVQDALLLAERIRNAVRDLKIAHAGVENGFVTLSAGVEALRPSALDGQSKELIEAADKALYQAKTQGRDRVCAAAHPSTS